MAVPRSSAARTYRAGPVASGTSAAIELGKSCSMRLGYTLTMPLPDQDERSRAATARLALADGTVFSGVAFGAADRGIVSVAEVVFNTAMCGYQESLTDPSYAGQILVATFPMIGNYGVNPEDAESQKVQVAGYVVRELARRHSNYRADSDLSDRKSTRLNSSHLGISYAVFCLKKK